MLIAITLRYSTSIIMWYSIVLVLLEAAVVFTDQIVKSLNIYV